MYKPTIELLDKTTHDLTHVRFKDGPFAGISFTLGEVSFQEDEDADSATMSYNYDIIENPYDTYDKETFEHIVDTFTFNDFLYHWSFCHEVCGTRFDHLIKEFCYNLIDVTYGNPGKMTQKILDADAEEQELTSQEQVEVTEIYSRRNWSLY